MSSTHNPTKHVERPRAPRKRSLPTFGVCSDSNAPTNHSKTAFKIPRVNNCRARWRDADRSSHSSHSSHDAIRAPVGVAASHSDGCASGEPAVFDGPAEYHLDIAKHGFVNDEQKHPELICAVVDNNVPEVRHLLAARANPNEHSLRETHITPLMAAAVHNCPESAEVLLKAGARPNDVSAAGAAPLHYAARRNHEKVVQVLARHGGVDLEQVFSEKQPDGSFAKSSAIHLAAGTGSHRVVACLLKAKANINTLTGVGHSGLEIALGSDWAQCVDAIATHSRVAAAADTTGQTPTQVFAATMYDHFYDGPHGNFAAAWARPLTATCARLLRNALLVGVAPIVNQEFSDGTLPLTKAANMGSLRLCKLLLDHGADVEALGACKSSRAEVVQFIEDYRTFRSCPCSSTTGGRCKSILDVLERRRPACVQRSRNAVEGEAGADDGAHLGCLARILKLGKVDFEASVNKTSLLVVAARNGDSIATHMLRAAGGRR